MAQLSQATVFTNEAISALREPVGRDRETYALQAYRVGMFIVATSAVPYARCGLVNPTPNSLELYIDEISFHASKNSYVNIGFYPATAFPNPSEWNASACSSGTSLLINCGRSKATAQNEPPSGRQTIYVPEFTTFTQKFDRPILLKDSNLFGIDTFNSQGVNMYLNANLRIVT